ncbi:unnamed protein product, partial [Prorocentrum cordatum]
WRGGWPGVALAAPGAGCASVGGREGGLSGRRGELRRSGLRGVSGRGRGLRRRLPRSGRCRAARRSAGGPAGRGRCRIGLRPSPGLSAVAARRGGGVPEVPPRRAGPLGARARTLAGCLPAERRRPPSAWARGRRAPAAPRGGGLPEPLPGARGPRRAGLPARRGRRPRRRARLRPRLAPRGRAPRGRGPRPARGALPGAAAGGGGLALRQPAPRWRPRRQRGPGGSARLVAPRGAVAGPARPGPRRVFVRRRPGCGGRCRRRRLLCHRAAGPGAAPRVRGAGGRRNQAEPLPGAPGHSPGRGPPVAAAGPRESGRLRRPDRDPCGAGHSRARREALRHAGEAAGRGRPAHRAEVGRGPPGGGCQRGAQRAASHGHSGRWGPHGLDGAGARLGRSARAGGGQGSAGRRHRPDAGVRALDHPAPV